MNGQNSGETLYFMGAEGARQMKICLNSQAKGQRQDEYMVDITYDL